MKTFNELVVEVLHILEADIRDDLSSTDVPDWDSMNYLIFISKLEENFEMSFSMDEVLQVKNIGDLRKLVEERGKK
jgi:acyl carrier protein